MPVKLNMLSLTSIRYKHVRAPETRVEQSGLIDVLLMVYYMMWSCFRDVYWLYVYCIFESWVSKELESNITWVLHAYILAKDVLDLNTFSSWSLAHGKCVRSRLVQLFFLFHATKWAQKKGTFWTHLRATIASTSSLMYGIILTDVFWSERVLWFTRAESALWTCCGLSLTFNAFSRQWNQKVSFIYQQIRFMLFLFQWFFFADLQFG
jgi:hypothetical protein